MLSSFSITSGTLDCLAVKAISRSVTVDRDEMPRKNDKRKGRRQTPRSIATMSSGATRRNAASSASAAGATSSPGPSTGARITQNSRGNRSAGGGRKAIRRAPPPKKQNKRGRGKKEKQQLQDLSSYRADTGEVYKRGGKRVSRRYACV